MKPSSSGPAAALATISFCPLLEDADPTQKREPSSVRSVQPLAAPGGALFCGFRDSDDGRDVGNVTIALGDVTLSRA